MRIVRAGEMPSAAAAACSEVVANGVGGCCLRERLVTAATVAVVAPSTWPYAISAASLSVKRAILCAILKRSSSAAPCAAPMPRICQ